MEEIGQQEQGPLLPSSRAGHHIIRLPKGSDKHPRKDTKASLLIANHQRKRRGQDVPQCAVHDSTFRPAQGGTQRQILELGQAEDSDWADHDQILEVPAGLLRLLQELQREPEEIEADPCGKRRGSADRKEAVVR